MAATITTTTHMVTIPDTPIVPPHIVMPTLLLKLPLDSECVVLFLLLSTVSEPILPDPVRVVVLEVVDVLVELDTPSLPTIVLLFVESVLRSFETSRFVVRFVFSVVLLFVVGSGAEEGEADGAEAGA